MEKNAVIQGYGRPHRTPEFRICNALEITLWGGGMVVRSVFRA